MASRKPVACAVLSHDTALAFWSNPLLPASLPALSKPAANRALANASGTLHVPELDALAQLGPFAHLPQQLDLLVPSANDHRTTRRARMRVWATPLPARALCELDLPASSAPRARVVLSSPEFTFLQMAQLVDDLELAEIGCELCGEYALAPLAADGFARRSPVTTPKAIAEFVSAADGAPGILRARRVAKLLVAGSRSPKETQIALLAHLPRRAGGAGLPAPQMNARIDVSGQAGTVLDTAWASPDLFWPEARVAIEYDSRAFHEGTLPSEHDARKRNVYSLMNIEAYTLTAGQVSDARALFSLFAAIASRLGIRRTKPNAKMLAARARAHAFLMAGERRERFTDPALFVPVSRGMAAELRE